MTGIGDRLVGMEVDLLVFDGPPETLDKDVVEYPATAIHSDPDIVFLQQPGKRTAGKLAALIGVENFRLRYPRAFSRAEIQKCVSRVVESSQSSTERLYQSIMATR